MKDKIHNFFTLYTKSVEENRSEISIQLRDAGIDTDALKKNLLNMIRKEEAQLKRERGKRFKAEFFKLVGENNTDGTNRNGTGKQGLRYAARKAGEGDKVNNFDDDKSKLELIRKIKKEKF